MDAPTVRDESELVADVLEHLADALPDVIRSYPPGYLVALVRHSALLGRDRFGLDTTASIRLFVRLRWEIGAGYYHHPVVSAALSDRTRPSMERFETLLWAEMETVWLEAMEYDGPDYWRGTKSDGFDVTDD